MKELIIYMAQALVDKPDNVHVYEVDGGHTTIYELKVSKEDIGKVVGKQGRTAQAMRTIVSAASSKQRRNALLEIIE